MSMKIKVKKIFPEAKLPIYATTGAVCFDLHGYLDEPRNHKGTYDSVLGSNVHGSYIFRTGLQFEIPEGYCMKIYSRSGHGFKHDVRLANCVGIIDSDYRGEVKVKLTYDGITHTSLHFSNGDRIAQAMIVPVEQIKFEETDELSDTERGEGGFGHTKQ